jgi:dienelactone hydrolase
MKIELSSSAKYQDCIAQFDYDPSVPLDVHESGLEYREGIAVRDVSYASVAPGRVKALLVAPPGEGKYPAVIFVHPGPGSRYTFLDEAVELAQHGAVSLLIGAPSSREQASGRTMGEPEHDLEEHRKTAKDLRRAIDLVTTRPGVDAEHIAYVGHGLGALFGGVLTGVEKRIKTFVLMAGAGSFTDVAVLNIPQLRGLALDHYRQVLMPIDPLYYIRFAAPAPLLFQFGLRDRSLARDRFIELAAAGSEPKAVKWYNADHHLPDPAARRDRLEWLRIHLNPGEREWAQPSTAEASTTTRPEESGRE